METDAPRPAPSSDGASPFSGSLREGKDSPCVVRARSLCRNFREKNRNVTALSSLDVDIPAGCMTALVGPDGAGKTTFLRMVCGLLAPSSGTLSVLGRDMPREAQEVQNRISYMPQRFGLYEDLSVMENMTLYADLHGVPGPLRAGRFRSLLDMTDLARFTGRPAGAGLHAGAFPGTSAARRAFRRGGPAFPAGAVGHHRNHGEGRASFRHHQHRLYG